MTLPEEIQYLKEQLRMNQVRYARCVQEKDSIAMDYLALKNRDLIDQLNKMESNRPSSNLFTRGSEQRLR